MSEPVRLDRRVAELMRCSRADALRYIEGGWVTVEGVPVDAPQAMVAGEHVEVDGTATPGAVEPATLLLHKPASLALDATPALVTAAARSDLDSSGIRPTERHFRHLAPLMPLDDDASGLVVLTQDGRIRRRLVEDYASIEQEFVVEVDGQLPPYGLARLVRGMRYEGRELPPCKVSWQNEIRLRFAIKDVRRGQLRHMCAEVGLGVVAMRRIRIGRVALAKMAVGQWRYLPAGERF
jgi:23S rRNA pseudouridine2604 synthase